MGNPIPSRDARELFIYLLGFDAVPPEQKNGLDRIRTGEFDKWEKMKRIARFEAQIRADAYEQAAKVADSYNLPSIASPGCDPGTARNIARAIRALSDQPGSTHEGLATATHGGLAGELSVLLAHYRKPNSTTADAFALRSHMVAHADEIIAALSTGRQP